MEFKRCSGILMPISSLPGGYGIGSMGKPAHDFVDFLAKAGQTIWQILPVGPTGYADSPYQSCSAFAGNPYFIDLDLLAADGLKAAKSAALWLYSNGAGADALPETLGVVTPWNTAAGTTAVTAMQVQQVGTGILPGVALDTAVADALTANELTLQDSEKHTKAERTAFVDGALAALGAE